MQAIDTHRAPDEVRAWFRQSGTTIRGWALQNGFRPAQVYAALAGRTSGQRGDAHTVACALGLKLPANVVTDFSPPGRAGTDGNALPSTNAKDAP